MKNRHPPRGSEENEKVRERNSHGRVTKITMEAALSTPGAAPADPAEAVEEAEVGVKIAVMMMMTTIWSKSDTSIEYDVLLRTS